MSIKSEAALMAASVEQLDSEVRKLMAEVQAWRARFPGHEYANGAILSKDSVPELRNVKKGREHLLVEAEGTFGVEGCAVCGGSESSLPTECPGAKINLLQRDLIWRGSLDFVNGGWVQK